MNDSYSPQVGGQKKDPIIKSPSKTYPIRPGTTNSGRDYETKIAVLLLLRCVTQTNTKHAWLAMNVDQCGAFDDVVLYREQKDGREAIYLIQLKHEVKGTNIKAEEFQTKKKSPFLLAKYIESILQITGTKKPKQSAESIAKERTARGKLEGEEGETEGVIDFILRNSNKIIYVLFTNRGTTTGCNFLKKVDKKSITDTRLMLYETINTTSNGIAFEFDFKKLDKAYEDSQDLTDNFFLFTKQEHVTKLDTAILSSIKSFIQPVRLTKSELSDVCLKFVQFLTDWSKGSLGGYYQLTKEHVLKKLTELLLEPYMVRLEDRNNTKLGLKNEWNHIVADQDVILINEADDLVVDFVTDATENILNDYRKNLKGWWKDNEDVVKQEILSALSSSKKNYCPEIYQYLWKTRKIPLLLEVGDSQTAKQVHDILRLSQGIFRVIVLNKSEKVIDRVSDLKVFVNMDDLNQTNREIILLRPVVLQGRLSTLLLKDVVDSDNFKYVTTKDVIYILCDKFTIGNKSEPLPEFFEETSLARVWLETSVLLEISRDIFIVKCFNLDKFNIYLHSYSEKARNLLMCSWQDVGNNPEPRIITCKDENDLNEIENYCLGKGKQFHLLAFYDTGNLEWIKSSGSVNSIKSFRQQSILDLKSLGQKYLISTIVENRKSALVCSNPGMGKSVLINYIAQNVPPNWWVLKINLAEHRNTYNNWEGAHPSSELFNSFVNILLMQQKCNNSFSEAVFRKHFKNENVIFLMDGFDEIPIAYQNGARKLVKFMHDVGYVMCVTTRPVFKLELESILNTFSMSLNLFTRTNQESYLKNYFSSAANIMSTDERVQFFVQQLLDTTKRNLNDHDNLFAGVPLQTMLLAQVFVGDCIKYLKTEEFTNTHFDLLYLYKHFFKEKLQIARAKVEGVSEDSISQYQVCRSFYALRVIFPEHNLKALQIDQKLKSASDLFPLMIQLIQKDGVVVAEKENDVTFVHRTFAEYLAAEWMAENIRGDNEGIVKNLVKEIFQPNFEVVRNIFDRILAEGCRLHLAIINRQIDEVKEITKWYTDVYNEKDKGSRIFLHLIASWGQHHPLTEPTSLDIITLRKLAAKDEMKQILKLIPSCELARTNKDDILNYTPLDYAIISGSLNIANSVCARLNNPYHFELLKTLSSRATYMYKMNYNSLQNAFIEFGFSCFNLQQNISRQEGTRGSLYYAIEIGFIDDVLPLISRKRYINSADAETGYTPLHIAVMYGHTDIASLLLSHKADPNKRDNIGRTPLHWAFSRNTKNIGSIKSTYMNNIEIDKEHETNGTDKIHNLSKCTDCNDTTSIFIEMLSRDKYVDIADNDGNTPLILSAYIGHSNAVSVLLSRGAEVEAKNKKGDTALTVSASNGQIDIVNLLLSHGANKEVKNCYGYTALLAAAIYGQIDVVKLLLSKGSEKEAKGNSGNTSLMVAACGGHSEIVCVLLSEGSGINAKNKKKNTALSLATYNGHLDAVYELLLRGADMEVKREDGHTALLVAAYNGLTDIANLLLCHGANKEARNNKSETALTIAAQYGHTEIVSLFMSHGLDKEAKNIEDFTALSLAAWYGHTDTVDVLLSRNCNKDTKGKDNETPLTLAAGNGHADVIYLLLSAGLDMESKTNFGMTALALASDRGHIDVVNLLLSHGANKETKTSEEATPLILAARSGHTDVANLLLSRGSEKEPKTQRGDNALILAALKGHIDTVKLLLSHGCDKDATNDDGDTVLIVAAQNGHTDIVNFLLSLDLDKEAKNLSGYTAYVVAAGNGHADVINLLLSAGADEEAKTDFGNTALTMASDKGHTDVVKLLLSHGANKESRTSEDATALILAARSGRTDVVKLLLSRGANKEAETKYGDTALILAVRNGHTDTVKLLLSQGCDKNAKNDAGDTAETVAETDGKTEIVNLLRSKSPEVDENAVKPDKKALFKDRSCAIS